MLAANPYRSDRAGAPELKRFLTGVVSCEVTGVVTTPDQRTMFVNLQHPGEGGGPAVAPATASRAPVGHRLVTKDDGGVVGT